MPPAVVSSLETRRAVEATHRPHHDDEEHNKIAVTQGFRQENATQIALVGELTKDSRRGATHGETEIDGIAQINGQRQAIDDEVYGTTELLVNGSLLEMQGEQHHHDIRDVSYQNS